MNPQLLRAIFAILIVRAIFLSPAQGSEFGPSDRVGDSALKRLDAIRPSRLRFTKPAPVSPSIVRGDCLDGGDGDDERISLADRTADDRFWAVMPLRTGPDRPLITSIPLLPVRLRC